MTKFQEDARVNSVTGIHGFVPSVKDNGLTVWGGIALHDQVRGLDRFVGDHLELDSTQDVHREDRGVVVTSGEEGGCLSLGVDMGFNKLFDETRVADTGIKSDSIHCNSHKYSQEHIVNVIVNGKVMPMLLDSGTQVSVIRTELLQNSDVSNDVIENIKLLGAFGDPVAAKII